MKPEDLYGLVPISRTIMRRPIYYTPPHWRLLYFHIRLTVNYADDQPVVGLKRNQGHFEFPTLKPYLAGMKRGAYSRAIDWMKGTPELDASDPDYRAPIIEAERTTRGLRITWVEPEASMELPEMAAAPMAPAQQPQLPLPPADGKPPAKTPAKRPAKRKSVDTWLTPFGEAWQAHCGGEIHWGQAAANFRALVDAHGPDTVLEYWKNYLKRNQPDKCSPARFKSTFKTWSPSGSAQRQGGVSEADYTNALGYEGKE